MSWENGRPSDRTSFEPARLAEAVTPNDSGSLEKVKGLYIGGAGNVTVDTVGGSTNVLFASAQAGSVLPIQVTRVYATGTTATSIVALK